MSYPGKSAQEGLTLVELLVAVGVVTMVLVAVASGVSLSVRNTRFSSEKSLSVRHAQETIEWLRGQRDKLGWRAFYQVLDNDSVSDEVTYCLPSLSEQTSFFQGLINSACSGTQTIPGSNFTRSVVLGLNPPQNDEVTILVEVTWDGGNGTETTSIDSTLREWR